MTDIQVNGNRSVVFYECYLKHLHAAYDADPAKYAWGRAEASNIARKMVIALRGRTAIVSETVKLVCKELGITPTMAEISGYLNE